MRLLFALTLTLQVAFASAVDHYQKGQWEEAVDAFARGGTFPRGQEHLRYYHAVALFETGKYDEAKKELACALPFIQETEDVLRYRAKIDGMAAVTP